MAFYIFSFVVLVLFNVYINYLFVCFIVSYFNNIEEYKRRYWGKNRIYIFEYIVKVLGFNVLYAYFISALLRAV